MLHRMLSNIVYLYCFRFLYCSEKCTDEDKIQVDRNMADILEKQTPIHASNNLINDITTLPYSSGKQQFLLLGSISNYHWMDVPSLTSDKLVDQSTSRYVSHVLTWQVDENEERRRYIPSSPRNRLMHLLTKDASSSFHHLVKFLYKKDTSQDEITDDVPPEIEDVPPVQKKRRIAPRAMSVTPRAFANSVGVDLNELLNCAKPNRSLYTHFKEELLTNGTIKWRSHDFRSDTCIMTDVNSSTGIMIPNSFVHVTYEKQMDGKILFKCTCDIYKIISRAAQQEFPILPNLSDVVPDDTFTCMHCRFFKDHLMNAYSDATACSSDATGRQPKTIAMALNKVKASLQDIDKQVFLLGNVHPTGTTKFSVQGEATYSIVNLTFSHGKCNVRCSDGLCQAQMISKKKIPKNPALMNIDNLCSHLGAIKSQIEYVQNFFPEYFSQVDQDGQNQEHQQIELNELNADDENLKSDAPNFNPESGLWDFKAKSQHVPKKMMDPKLVNATVIRNQASIRLDGMINLKPSPTNDDGINKMCECGQGFSDAGQYILSTTATLYTRIGAIPCNAYNLKCDSGQCELTFHHVAEQEGIFFYTNFTCAGDEVGWDFVSLVMKTKTSFTAYTNEMTRRYQTNRINAPKFMSPNTFVNWFFGWLSAMKIDFRKEIDPWCGHDPKILACDGTHIGVNIKHMQLNKAVILPDNDQEYQAQHRRKDRSIIHDDEARKHLRYMASKWMNKVKPDKIISPNEEHIRNVQLLQKIHKPGLYNFIEGFVKQTAPQPMLSWMAKLLHMLSGDAAPSSVAPFRAHPLIVNVCTINDINHQLLNELKQYSFEMVQLINLAHTHNCRPLVEEFLLDLLDHIDTVHSQNKVPPPAVPIKGTYNPPGGVAYYFSETGEQVREMPHYKVGDKARPNYDDIPVVHGPCTKNYPGVSFGGFGYMFIWFCPIHGHTYGFHLIAGGEGRRDPFSSLFKYKKTMPQEIFYDFACSLSEFALNREPTLFRNTRFWHDLFHALGHLCGWNFKSGRVVGLESINTEICEQVNSYLQCIKYTGSHLSQEHFMFFTQFFLYMLNCNKTELYRKQATIAYQCQQ